MPELDNPTFRQLQVITDAVREYHELANVVVPTQKNFADWLATLPNEHRATLAPLGMFHCWMLHPFRRFVYERQGHRLDDFLKNRLGPDEYAIWSSL